MLASWVRDSTSTTGTGTITLAGSPAAGFIGFDDAFSDGDVVSYVIHDGNNREAGVGVLTSGASWTLARTQIFEKLDSGTYSQWPATGISLSGSATVMCAPSALSTYDAGSHCKPYNSSSVYGMPGDLHLGTSSSNWTPVGDRLYIVPIALLHPIEVDTIMMRCVTASSGSTCRVGLYKMSHSVFPMTLIDEAAIDMTSTGARTASLSGNIVLEPGFRYALAFIVTHGTPSLVVTGLNRELLQGAPFGIDMSAAGGDKAAMEKDLVSWSTLPSSLSSSDFSQSSETYFPLMSFRLES